MAVALPAPEPSGTASPHGVEAASGAELGTALAACRAGTLALVDDLDDAALAAQPDPGFSPIGWHLGHIAFTEALWLDQGRATRRDWGLLFRQDGLPKHERRSLPPRTAILDFLASVRDRTFARLAEGPPEPEYRIWRFILQHECQHAETVAILRRLAGFGAAPPEPMVGGVEDAADATFTVPGGPIQRGHDGIMALDNERPAHAIDVAPFRLSRRPVCQNAYRRFLEAGGYHDPRLWSAEGWAWRTANAVERPRHWWRSRVAAPVCGVSAYEAEAYCRFIGARLPTESEWEAAAASAPQPGLMGEVWQWTATIFGPYPGFEPYPYPGYSSAYFDGRHRVLKGGSWATRQWVLRPSFRNWYEPGTQQIFAGFRYATDA